VEQLGAHVVHCPHAIDPGLVLAPTNITNKDFANSFFMVSLNIPKPG
jgi:hypothetical protein